MFRGVPDLTGWVVGVWGVTHVFVRCVSLYVSVGYALSAGPAHTLRHSSYAAARQRGRLVCVPPPPLRVPPGVGWSVARGV